MDNISKAIDMMMKQMKDEIGDDYQLEEGEEIAGVFNDGVIIVGLENKSLRVNILAGEPMKFDFNLDLIEEIE